MNDNEKVVIRVTSSKFHVTCSMFQGFFPCNLKPGTPSIKASADFVTPAGTGHKPFPLNFLSG